MKRVEKLKALLLRLRGAFYEPASPAHCRVCGRRLTSAASIAAGMGSCCARKHAKDEKTLDLFQQEYI